MFREAERVCRRTGYGLICNYKFIQGFLYEAYTYTYGSNLVSCIAVNKKSHLSYINICLLI